MKAMNFQKKDHFSSLENETLHIQKKIFSHEGILNIFFLNSCVLCSKCFKVCHDSRHKRRRINRIHHIFTIIFYSKRAILTLLALKLCWEIFFRWKLSLMERWKVGRNENVSLETQKSDRREMKRMINANLNEIRVFSYFVINHMSLNI